jgi:chromosome segregation ATPase
MESDYVWPVLTAGIFTAQLITAVMGGLRVRQLRQATMDVESLSDRLDSHEQLNTDETPTWLAPVSRVLAALSTIHGGEPRRTGSASESVHPADLDPPLGSADSTPTLLAWLGMLGTFLGVALALGKLDLKVDDAKQVSEQVQKMVGPLGAAFWTSITGLGAAFFVRAGLLWRRGQLDTSLAHLLRKFDDSRPLISPTELLSAAVADAARPARQSADRLDALLKALVGDGQTGLLPQLLAAQQATTAAISQRPSHAEAIAKALRLLEHEAREAKQLRANVKAIKTSTNELSSELAEAIDNAIMGAVNGSDGQPGILAKVEQVATSIQTSHTTSASTMADQLVESIDERIGPRLDGFGQSVEKVVAVNNQWDDRLSDLRSQLSTATSELQSASSSLQSAGSTLESSAGSLSETFDRTDTTLTQLDHALGTITAQMASLSSSFQDTRSDWTQERAAWQDTAQQLSALRDAVDGMSALWTSWKEALAEQTTLTSTLAADREQGAALLEQIRSAASGFAEVSEQMASLSGSLKQDLESIEASRDAGTQAIDEKLARLRDLASDTRTLFDGYQKTFTELGASMPDLTGALDAVDTVTARQQAALDVASALAERLETASTQVQSLGSVLDPLQTAAQSLTPAATQLSEGTARLSTMLERSSQTLDATRETAHALTAVSQTLQRDTKDATAAWTASATQLQSSRADLEAAATALNQAAAAFGQNVQEIVRDLGDQQDKQLGNAVSHLQKAVASLSSLTGPLAESVDTLAFALDEHRGEQR